CTIAATFAPQAQGQRTASLVITDDGTGSPQSVALSGSGAAAFQLTASGATTATVTAGQSTQYALQVTSGPGFSGNVAFTCTGAPLAATCSVTPNSIALSGAAATPLQVSVATTGNAVVFPLVIEPRSFRGWPVAALSLAMWLWALFCWTRKTRDERFRYASAF